MNPQDATQTRELVFLRFEQSFGDFLSSLLPGPLWQAVPYYALGGIAAVLTLIWVIRTIVRLTSHDTAWHARPGHAGQILWRACVASWVLFGIWFLFVFFQNDSFGSPPISGEGIGATRAANTAFWSVFIGAVFVLATTYTIAMYVKDSRSVRWYWASFLALTRIVVYVALVFVFLLPAYQTYERTEKRSRVLVVLDVSPSLVKKSDEIASQPGKKLRSRLATVIEFLTDDRVEFLKKLLEENPIAVYRFGTRLDEEPELITKESPTWPAAEWEAFTRFDFKPFLDRGLSPEGRSILRTTAGWNDDQPGTAEWAKAWEASFKAQYEKNETNEKGEIVRVTRTAPSGMSDADRDRLHDNVGKLAARVRVAEAIALGTSVGTNVPYSLTAAINREAGNMVQGIVVFSDGRSNMGSDSAYAELKQRAAREKVPIFTVAVGEDRQTVSIALTPVQAPDNAPPDEAFKIIVEADGTNLANTEVDVFLDLFLPNRDPKTEPPDHTLSAKLVFQPGDPPHGQMEFVIDPAKMPERLTEESKEAATKKRVLKEGSWTARARIPKHRQEAFPDPEHVQDRPRIQVFKKPLRVLLVASGPSREYQNLKNLLVREVQESRAELSILLQNKAAEEGTAVQDVVPDRLLTRFPTKLDTTAKSADPKEKYYNLNEYDLIVAFDPDWSELSQAQAEMLQRWVQEQGGGLIYVADRVNTFQLARVDPTNGVLLPLLDILPVIPDDVIAVQVKGTPRTPRRLYFHPIEGSDLLKLEESTTDPTAGWEKFFTDNDRYTPSPDLRVELFPHRGFFSTYPLKQDIGVKPGSKVLAELGDQADNGEKFLRPWLVTNNPSAGWRTCFIGSGQMYRIFAFDPPNGRTYYERFWAKLMKYMAAKRNVKNSRGRVLLSKEYSVGSPIRVQARILDPGSLKYPIGAIDPKFRIVRLNADGQTEKILGPFQMTAKQTGGFDGYYEGQITPDPKEMPPGDKQKGGRPYRVVIDVPDSAGDTLDGAFLLNASDIEMDNTRPDHDAMRMMAGELDNDLKARIKKEGVVEKLSAGLPKEGGVPKLAFKLTDTELLKLIPDCMGTREVNADNRGKSDDLWDKGFTVPESLTFVGKPPQQVSYMLLAIVGLLCIEWMTRKLLRLA